MTQNSFLKRALLLLIISIFSIQFSYGQSNYLPGQVVTTKGDTLQGSIYYKDWRFSPKEITFKSDSLDIIQDFTPKDIKYFRVNNEVYISAKIEIEASPIMTKELETNSKLEIINKTAFISVIFDGDKKLYQYRSSKYQKEQFYI